MSTAILRPCPLVDPVEAMRMRDCFDLVAATAERVIVDLSGITQLSAAGLAAVTNTVLRGRGMGMAVTVLLPERASAAARIIDQADLWRFLCSGGLWDGAPDHKPARRPADSVPQRVAARVAQFERLQCAHSRLVTV